jgi:outer membrane immunogenic protein
MKRLLLAATSLIAIGGVASAADLPAFEEAPAIIAPVPNELWTGFYVGGQLGYAFNNDDDDGCFSGEGDGGGAFDCGDFADFDGDGDDDNGSFVLGAHVGADWQFGSVVVGGILDLNWLADGDDDDDDDGDDEFDLDDIAGGPERFATLGFEDFDGIDWYGTLRGRVGLAPGAGRFLIYGTGGLAFANGSDGGATSAEFENGAEAANFFDDPAIDTLGEVADLGDCERVGGPGSNVRCEFDDGDDDGVGFGWTLGAGAEVLVTDRFSVGAEYLFVNLDEGDDDDDNGVEFESGAFVDNDDDNDLDFHTVTLKGSFRF